MKRVLLGLIFIGFITVVMAQNIAITDDNAYTANTSAMLDIKSVTKGMLVPRMTSVQRTSIVSPATGLLVFDTNENIFYYYTGTAWTNMSTGQLWSKNGNYVYLTNTDENVGIGVTAPDNKLLVKADATTGIDESIFAVLNNNGDTVFAVYQEGVRIWVNDVGGTKANGSRGGFAVGGYNPAKLGFTNEYLRVTPDSVRIYIDESFVAAKANGSRGGFAVGGFNPAKGTNTENYMIVSLDTTETTNPSEPRILWYPTKEAFLTGRVIIENKDSIGINSFASGFESKAMGNFSQALGYHARARGNNSTAIGNYANAETGNSFALGDSARVIGVGAYAIGSVGRDVFGNSTGLPTQANGDYSFAIGMGAVADTLGAFAIGNKSLASGGFSMALGYESYAWGDYSVALGSNSHAGNYASSLGYATWASGDYSTAMGNECVSTGANSLSCGFFNTASGIAATALGAESMASGYAAITFGSQNAATGNYSLAGGFQSQANGYLSYAFGESAYANNLYSVVFGQGMRVDGISSFGIALNDQTGAILADNNTMAIMGGEVGIGTLSPAYPLDITGSANLNNGIVSGGALYVNSSEAIWYDGTYYSWGAGGTANYFADNVGIGTTTPTTKLDVIGYGHFRNSIGLNTYDFGGGNRAIAITTGVAPSASITNGVLLYAQNLNAELKVRDEAGNITVLSPHNFSLIPKSEPMAWSYHSENANIGQIINVDMLKTIRLVESLTGEKLVYISDLNNNIIKDKNLNKQSLIETINKQQGQIDGLENRVKELELLIKSTRD